MAESADKSVVPEGMDIPKELERREDRLQAIDEVKAEIERRAQERFKPPGSTPLPKDQVNLTDEGSRIMQVAGKGFDQCYNAQAAVAVGSMLVVATEVTQAPNDVRQVVPMVDKITALPEELGKVDRLPADTGYMSAGNVDACEKAGIEPMIAMGRESHHPGLLERFAAAPPEPAENATPVQRMVHRLKTRWRSCEAQVRQADTQAAAATAARITPAAACRWPRRGCCARCTHGR